MSTTLLFPYLATKQRICGNIPKICRTFILVLFFGTGRFPLLVMDIQDCTELNEIPQMLPPPPGSFIDREELIQHVGDFALSQGYVVTIKQSKKDKVVVLGCDRGGVYRNRRKLVDESSAEQVRKRKTGSRLTNCPFEVVGKKEDGLWVLAIKNGEHNHDPIRDISEHPSSRRFTEREVLLIKDMTEAGLKPRQILKRLRQNNPELLSTPKHVYNVKAKLRQGNLTGGIPIPTLLSLAFHSLFPQKNPFQHSLNGSRFFFL